MLSSLFHSSHNMIAKESTKDVFTNGKEFWNNYLKGRPSAPDVFFDRIFRYHEAHNGEFGTVHDVGAGNGPYAAKLRSRFEHVILSDISAENVALAKERMGTYGFTYRTAGLEVCDDIPKASVDMVFATNMMHFCDQEQAMKSVATQLKPGGTFACAAFGAAQFEDPIIHDIYIRISQAGARVLFSKVKDPEKLISAAARTQGPYNVAPLDEAFFSPGAQRIALNMPPQGMTSPLPPEIEVVQPVCTGVDDFNISESEAGWSFVTNLDGIREHIESFPFGREVPDDLWQEMKQATREQAIKGHWPAKIILATRI